MPAPTLGDGALGLKPVLKTPADDDRSKTPSSSSSVPKAVQIIDPETDAATVEDNLPRKQFNAGIGLKRLSGRMPAPTNSSKSSLVGPASTEDLSARQGDAAPIPPTAAPGPSSGSGGINNPVADTGAEPPSGDAATSAGPHISASAPNLSLLGSPSRPRQSHSGELLLARVGEWLDQQKRKASRRKETPPSAETQQGAPATTRADGNEGEEAVRPRERADSMDSQSSEISLDRLQRILEDSMATMGLSAIPAASPGLRRRSSGKLRNRPPRLLPGKGATSDTDVPEVDAVVPTCEAVLDNTRTLRYPADFANAEDPPISPSSLSKRDKRARQAWVGFKNEVIRLAHTLRLRGWRSVPLDAGETISVERLSGALTNAVYLVTPPKNAALLRPPTPAAPGEPPRKGPKKLLLRIYGPQVDQLIDRESELSVLRRLAKKRIGPRLLGTFTNGRFEEYFNASALNPRDLRDPDTSRQIAKRMRELHDGIELLGEERSAGPNVWRNWDRWLATVGKRASILDEIVKSSSGGEEGGAKGPAEALRARGFVCGLEWPLFKELVDRYRSYVEGFYSGEKNLRDRLVFSHNDTQYGNILRVRPDDTKSPLLQPANKHKQLIVIDFEYSAANVPGLEFANHFTEWCYNYHDPHASFACDAGRYPTAEEQYRFLRAYVEHKPQFPHGGGSATPQITAVDAATGNLVVTVGSGSSGGSGSGAVSGSGRGGTVSEGASPRPMLVHSHSSNSITDFILDARGPAYSAWKEEERIREEAIEGIVRELSREARLWRAANSAQWVAWGIVQAKIPVPGEDGEGKSGDKSSCEESGCETTTAAAGAATTTKAEEDRESAASEENGGGEDEFDYIRYAQERAMFFLGDCLQLGLVKEEELPPGVREQLKIVEC